MSTTIVPKFSIAPAVVEDCRECARLLVGQLDEHGVDASAERLERLLEKVVASAERGFLLLARDRGRMVGVAYVATMLSAEHCGIVAWLEELYVAPDYRSQGIGTALVSAVLARARETGIVAMDGNRWEPQSCGDVVSTIRLSSFGPCTMGERIATITPPNHALQRTAAGRRRMTISSATAQEPPNK